MYSIMAYKYVLCDYELYCNKAVSDNVHYVKSTLNNERTHIKRRGGVPFVGGFFGEGWSRVIIYISEGQL